FVPITKRLMFGRALARRLRGLLLFAGPDHRLDVVSVGIEHERGVAVVVALARLTVVAAAGLHRCLVERAHALAIRRMEGEVRGRADLAGCHPEVVAAVVLEAGRLAVALGERVAERREGLLVEAAAAPGVGAAKADVLDHAVGLRTRARSGKR